MSSQNATATVTNLADWRALRSWVATAAHLNALGYPVPVPASLMSVLSRRGLMVWAADEREAA
jgi:hypothetical protein